jgi:hypothetical protein
LFGDSTVGKALTFTLSAGVVALAVVVLAPWHAFGTDAPATGDDPLSQRAIVRPVPSALAHRGLQKTDSDESLLLGNWNFTDVDPSDAF